MGRFFDGKGETRGKVGDEKMAALKVMKTYAARPAEINPRWHLLDAEGKVLGRLATEIVRVLQGKHKPIYTPHMLTGDFVVVVNAGKVRVTGKKEKQKLYRTHSGYSGGLRELTMEQLMQRDPTRALRIAVVGMLPKTSLGRMMLKRLKVYGGPSHPHQAQVAGFGTSTKVEEGMV